MDIFFVLSGYLITRVLTGHGGDIDRRDLFSFYIRRAARLYPALAITVTLCLVARFAFHPATAISYRVAVEALSYTTDVFAVLAAPLNVMSHAWSLSVEEQFYLVWPLLLVAFPRRRSALCVMVILLSIASSLLLSTSVSYYSPTGRAFELASGACLAVFAWRPTRSACLCGAVLLATALVAGSAGHTNLSAAGQLACMLSATAGSVLLIGAAGQGQLRVLESTGLVWIGERSYGIYLLHFPILLTLPRQGWWLLLSFGATVAAAAVSFRWVEGPIQSMTRGWLVNRRKGSRPTSNESSTV